MREQNAAWKKLLVSKRIKAMKRADVSELIWLSVKEYLPDELAPNFNDEKCFEQRGERRGSNGPVFLEDHLITSLAL